MIVVMKAGSQDKEIDVVMDRLHSLGLQGHLSKGVERTVIGVVGVTSAMPDLRERLELVPGVAEVVPISKPFKLSSREFEPENTVIDVGGVKIGGNELVVMAGPCAAGDAGAGDEHGPGGQGRRGQNPAGRRLQAQHFPLFVPRSGRGRPEATGRGHARRTGLPLITEVLTPQDVELVVKYADILQVGARNMQNFILLDEVGQAKKPVMLKRGMSATIQEWLLAAEYILSQGNRQLILCERGIRTFETYTRNTMDVSAIPIVHKETHLPIIADPSHGTGKWDLVMPLALASVAAGADGLMIEVHPTPDTALKDGAQSLTFEHFGELMKRVGPVAKAVGRTMAGGKQKNA